MTRSYEDKAYFWMLVTVLAALPHVVLVPLQFAVDGMPWDVVIAALSLLFPVAQVAAFVRMAVCLHDAKWEGGE